jgi:CBS-domain-containing membrane protein
VDQIDEINEDIAAEQEMAEHPDDPIFLLQAVNDRLLKESAQAQEELIRRFKEELETLEYQWGEDAKSRAERILNAALAASKDAMKVEMEKGARVAAEQIQKEIKSSLKEVEKQSRVVATMNIAAALMALIAAGLALLSTIY